MLIREARYEDVSQLTDILNQSIRWGKATAITSEIDEQNRIEWLADHQELPYGVFVAELENQIHGYLSIGPYRKGREALKQTAEVSYFVDFNQHRGGVASALMNACFDHCKKNQITTLLAFLMAHNDASIMFLEKFGFECWGRFPEAISIQGVNHDHLIYGIKIKG